MNLEEKIKRARKRLKEFKLEKDNYIIGVYKGVREVNLQGKIRIMHRILNNSDGEEYGIWATAVLDEELQNKKVKIGEVIAVKYLGKPEGKNYHDWIVLKEEEEEKNGEENLPV